MWSPGIALDRQLTLFSQRQHLSIYSSKPNSSLGCRISLQSPGMSFFHDVHTLPSVSPSLLQIIWSQRTVDSGIGVVLASKRTKSVLNWYITIWELSQEMLEFILQIPYPDFSKAYTTFIFSNNFAVSSDGTKSCVVLILQKYRIYNILLTNDGNNI